MAEKKDQIRQAADALDALRNLRQPPEQTDANAQSERAAADLPAEQPLEQAVPPAQAAATDPFADLAFAASQTVSPSDQPAVHVAIRKVGNLKKQKLKRQKKEKKPPAPPPPPPVLTPLQRVQRTTQIELRRTAIPVLLTMGVAMLVLGCWSIGVLAMGINFFQPGEEVDVNAHYFAKIALLAWPIALVLLTGLGFFVYEVYTWFTMYPKPARPTGPGKPEKPLAEGF